MAIYRLGIDVPQIHPNAWVAESASVMGRVALGDGVGVWYSAVIRADNDRISVGAHSNVQDGCVLHADAGYPLAVGERVTIGHQAMLHGCTIGDGTLIGIQSVVLNGATVGRRSMLAAGTLVPLGKSFPDGVLLMGRPAKVVRELDAQELAHLEWAAAHYEEQAAHHRASGQRVD